MINETAERLGAVSRRRGAILDSTQSIVSESLRISEAMLAPSISSDEWEKLNAQVLALGDRLKSESIELEAVESELIALRSQMAKYRYSQEPL
jgi:hypothetical protein